MKVSLSKLPKGFSNVLVHWFANWTAMVAFAVIITKVNTGWSGTFACGAFGFLTGFNNGKVFQCWHMEWLANQMHSKVMAELQATPKAELERQKK